MQSVFVAGSITLKRLPQAFLERLDNLIDSELDVLVGDANGTDKAVQQELVDRGATSVTVFCAGIRPRNNLGEWPTKEIVSDAPAGTREFYTAKDLAMAASADFGLMLWDAKSTGTLSNVIELTKMGKVSVVYVAPEHAFTVIRDMDGLRKLIGLMSEDALQEAERKIDLSTKLQDGQHQLGFSF